MNNIVFNILFFIGLFYFVKFYSKQRKYLNIFFQLTCILFIIYCVDWIWKILVYSVEFDSTKVIFDTLIFIRNMILGSIGAFLLETNTYPTLPLVLDYKTEKNNIKSYSFVLLISVGLLIGITILLLVISSSPLFRTTELSIGSLVDLFTRSFIVATGEELYFRLFLQSILIFWLIKLYKNADIISIFIVSLIWASIHSGVLESGGFKFLQIFIMGLVLGYVMRRKGLEVCIAAHTIFNFVSYSLLGGFKIIDL